MHFVWLADRPFMPSWAPLVAVRAPLLMADVGLAWTLYAIVHRSTANRSLARFAAPAWLFTPILFYQTAIQGHHESVWLWPAVLAYWYTVRQDVEQAWQPSLLLAVAMALKQSAVLYTLPFGLYLLGRRRRKDLITFGVLSALIFGGIHCPFTSTVTTSSNWFFWNHPKCPFRRRAGLCDCWFLSVTWWNRRAALFP